MNIENFLHQGTEKLKESDPTLFDLLQLEHQRQNDSLWLVASASMSTPSILASSAMSIGNITTDGYPGSRYLPGCEFADRIEELAIDRAKNIFHAEHANLQPHSGTSANQSLLFRLLKQGETFMGMDLKAGGHLTHGAKASILGTYFNSQTYGVNEQGWIDYDLVRDLAKKVRPRLIIAGASAYPRLIDYKLFRTIADEVGAYLLADISHLSGLIAAEELPNPINDAHFCTSSTYKQICGPKGGMILLGKDGLDRAQGEKISLIESVDIGVAPLFQDTPSLAAITAKANAFNFIATDDYKNIARSILSSASVMADELISRGYHLQTGGTDNHMILLDLRPQGLTGLVAEQALEKCNIIANRNPIPFDPYPPYISAGIRFGSNILALRNLDRDTAIQVVNLIDTVLSNTKPIDQKEFNLPSDIIESVRAEVKEICDDFPVAGY